MVTNEGVKWDGKVKFFIIGENGFKKEVFSNKVTNYARNYIANTIVLGDGTHSLELPSKIELGTGTGTEAATDTDLWTPDASTMKACSTIQLYLDYYAQYIALWTTTDPIVGTWTEIGLFDASNNLWAHASINITINAGEILVAQWQVQIIGN